MVFPSIPTNKTQLSMQDQHTHTKKKKKKSPSDNYITLYTYIGGNVLLVKRTISAVLLVDLIISPCVLLNDRFSQNIKLLRYDKFNNLTTYI